jgi:translation elongation factor EF-Tu-like GTPase
MREIIDVHWITGKGCVAIVSEDDGYKINQEVEILQDNKVVKTSIITGIETKRGLVIHPIRGLVLRGIKFNEIKAGMFIKKT